MAAASTGARARLYGGCTLNNPSAEAATAYADALADGWITWLCYGEEVGASGTPHHQLAFYLKNPKAIGGIKRKGYPWSAMHLEIAKGSVEDQVKYCSKDGHFHEIGERPRQGSRTDLANCVAAVKAGKSIRRAIEDGDCCSWQGLNSYSTLEAVFRPPPPKYRAMRVMWLYGPTGCGKTVLASEILDAVLTVAPSDGTVAPASEAGARVPYVPTSLGELFWMGYTDQTAVLADDVSEISKARLQTLHQVLGGGRCNIRVSGGQRPCRVTDVIITSNEPPQAMFQGSHLVPGSDLTARWPEMCRRLTRGVYKIPDGVCLARWDHTLLPPGPRISPQGRALMDSFMRVGHVDMPVLSAFCGMGQFQSHPLPEPAEPEHLPAE